MAEKTPIEKTKIEPSKPNILTYSNFTIHTHSSGGVFWSSVYNKPKNPKDGTGFKCRVSAPEESLLTSIDKAILRIHDGFKPYDNEDTYYPNSPRDGYEAIARRDIAAGMKEADFTKKYSGFKAYKANDFSSLKTKKAK